ncbi:MAG: CxxC-x17-CxxC domain-containing protein [Candidatus Sericytochromatia bacterium]|nr:CxxC-x17-CxxC domain-containing protein [Candidatus Sericytochromatia bacterium]
MLYTDQIIACSDCGTEFTFSAKEQEFFAQKGFTSIPKRCKPCRNARKTQGPSRSEDGGRGGYGGGSGYGGGGYGGGGYGGGGGGFGSQRPREMHTVVCAQCGVETQVPFKPRGDRPVYCRSCFQK